MTCGPYDASQPARGAGDNRCPRDWQVIELQQCMPQDIIVTIENDTLDDIGDYSGGSLNLDLDADSLNLDEKVRLVYRDHYTSHSLHIALGERISARQFKFDINPGHVACPGLFVGEIIVWNDTSGDIVLSDTDEVANIPEVSAEAGSENYQINWVHRVFVEISPANLSIATNYPLSIAEVRMLLRDECPASNFLIDDLEYTNKEITYAIHRAVDYWNEVPPPVRKYSYASFPHRYHWGLAVMGSLLRQAALHKLRNWLPYSAGGISVQDQQNWEMYQKLGNQYWDEYREWVQGKKIELNVGGAFGGFTGWGE